MALHRKHADDSLHLSVSMFPENRQDLAALRFVVRNGVSRDLADMLVADLQRHVEYLDRLPQPLPRMDSGEGFRH
jgi:glutamate decarboxylase